MKHLQACINDAIEACRDLISHLTRKMHPDWEKAVLDKLQEPYTEMDQIFCHLFEKRDVETNSEMQVKNALAK